MKPFTIRSKSAALGLAALACLTACVPNQAIRNARVAPAGGSSGHVYLSADRFAVQAYQAGAADFYKVFGAGGLGGHSGLGLGGGQELGGGLRYTNGIDIGFELWWKAQLLGREEPRSAALSLEASVDTRLFMVPYDPGIGLLLALPLGRSDLLLNARYGYLWTEQEAGPAYLSIDADTGAYLPSNGTFGEAQLGFVFDATAPSTPYLGVSVRQFVEPARKDPFSRAHWIYEPTVRIECGLQFRSDPKKAQQNERSED